MPRTNREYLLRFADQALNDLERALERLKYMSDAYAGIAVPLEGQPMPGPSQDEEGYTGQYAKYQQFTDLVAAQVIQAHADLTLFRKNHM